MNETITLNGSYLDFSKNIFILRCIFYLLYLVSKDGSLIYSEVTSFLEKQQDTTTVYKSIATSGNKTIHLTGNHPIYTRKSGTDRFYPM